MEPKQIRIFSLQDSPRLKYIAGIIFGEILGIQWDITHDRRKLGKHPVINYSRENIKGSFKIIPDQLLFETGVNQREINVGEWKGLPVFFNSAEDSDIPFDIFAASFFMVSRYEEYLDFRPDEHGRFCASSSLAGRNGFLSIPVVDLWVREFARQLIKKYPVVAFRRSEFRSMVTIDIDEPFEYLGKNLLRSFGGMIRDITTKSGRAAERYRVVRHELKDPFAVYDYIFGKTKADSSNTRFFLPTGDSSRYDNNPSWKNEEYRSLIRMISGNYISGLHPSYFASGNRKIMDAEISRFRTITGKDPALSRFHYIRLFFPESYSNLAKAGIREDYSMGFHDEPGFRAGIARPFLFYDIKEEMQTELKIVPFEVMDATLFKYMKLDAASSKDIIFRIIDETRKAGGLFVSIWHNTYLLETPEWKPWRDLFESVIQYQRS